MGYTKRTRPPRKEAYYSDDYSHRTYVLVPIAKFAGRPDLFRAVVRLSIARALDTVRWNAAGTECVLKFAPGVWEQAVARVPGLARLQAGTHAQAQQATSRAAWMASNPPPLSQLKDALRG